MLAYLVATAEAATARQRERANAVAEMWGHTTSGTVLRTVPLRPLGFAIAAWCTALVIELAVVLNGHARDIPFQVYMAAGTRWLSKEPLYDLTNIDGFQYLPQSAAFFSLFARAGSPYSVVLWRTLGWVGLASGQWRLVRQLMPTRVADGFALTSAFTVVEASNCLYNGQANLALAALALHATAAVIAQRHWQASVILGCGFALKPLMLVPLLVVVGVYPRTRVRTAVVLVLLSLLPFVLSGYSYAVEQYASCLVKLRLCSAPDRLFEDLPSLLCTFGLRLPDDFYLGLRLGCALLVFAACLYIRRHVREPFAAVLAVSLSLSYLMLLNPRTLSSSYVMVTAVCALMAAGALIARRREAALVFGGCAAAWTLNHHVVHFVEHWLNPLACLVFCAALAVEIRRLSRAAPSRVP